MDNKKRFSLQKPAAYAVLSTAAFAALITVPAVVAHADVNFSGTTSLQGEVVITTQVELSDATANGSLRDAKVIIAPTAPDAIIDLGEVLVNDIEIKKSVSLKGKNLDNAQIVLNPDNADSEIDLSDSTATNIVIGNNNVSQITVADEVTSISVAEGVRADALTVLDKSGNPKEDIKIVPEKVENDSFKLSIMHFNDTHAHLDNAAKRVTAVNEVRAEKPDALLLDAGDVFSGTLYFNEFLGQADVKFMNLMKVDAMTFGNHEFDLGSSPEGHKALTDFIKAANFPFVSSNVDFSKDPLFDGLFNTKISTTPENSNIYTGIVKEVDGEKIGIFGLTTAETADIASPSDITFSDYIAEAKKMVAEFESMGVNKVVAITHIGFDDNPAMDNDIELAKAVEGIDVIVGGHSHTTLAKPVLIEENAEPTIIVQTGQYADNLGVLDVTFDDKGVVVSHEGELIKIADKTENPEAASMLKEYSDIIEQVKNEPTGATAVKALENPRTGGDNTKPSVRKNETPLGNVITDGMLAKAKEYNNEVVMAFQNGGGIREAIDAGPITVGEVISVLPFGNTLATMELTGAELKAAFEISVGSYPSESGGFLHVSGAKVEFDSSKPAGQRVVSISYKNSEGGYTEIQDGETYTIATNAFTAKGGDGYDVFAKAYEEGRVTDLGLSDWENLRDQLASLGEVDPQIENRIVDIVDVGQEPDTEIPGGVIPAQDFSGTADAPKVYNGDVTVSVSDVASFEHVIVKGNLILTGILMENVSIANITVEGDLNLSGLDADDYDFDGITVTGETIL